MSTANATQAENPAGYVELIRENREFRFLWMGQVVSLLGDWFNLIASASLIAMLTNSGTAIGGLFVVRMIAPFLVSPFAGVAADRYNRKWLLIGTDIIRGLTVLGFLFIRKPEDVWMVYALTGIQMSLSAFFFPTRNAILPDITVPRELGAANALASVTWSVMLAFGAALGGLFSGSVGVYPAFVVDALTFFVSGFIISRMIYTPPPEQSTSDKTVRAALRQYVDGLKYLRQHIDILVITLHKSANSLFVAGAYQVIQVTLAEQYFPIGEGGGISLGLMYGAVGIGTGIGPLIARRITGDREYPMKLALTSSYVISACGMLIASTVWSLPVVLLGGLLRGFGAGVMWVFSTQLLLEAVPGSVRGRVFSTEFMLFTLMSAISSGSTGWLLDGRFTPPEFLRVLAFLTLIPAILWGLWVFYGEGRVKQSPATP